jgi:hypothetical protein
MNPGLRGFSTERRRRPRAGSFPPCLSVLITKVAFDERDGGGLGGCADVNMDAVQFEIHPKRSDNAGTVPTAKWL